MGYKEALEDMVWQFAYRDTKGNKPVLHTGGLSALEGAFEVLGWEDPKVIEDTDGVICDVKNCPEWVTNQGMGWRNTGYWCLCSGHHEQSRSGKPKSQMKQRAMKRENSRNENGCLPVK